MATIPLVEVGVPAGTTTGYGAGATGTGWTVEGTDSNIALRFPAGTAVWDEMRRSDGKVASGLRALTAPILGTRWRLSGEHVPEDVAAFITANLGLTAEGVPTRAARRLGIDWTEFLRHALLMLPLGFMPFEKVYALNDLDGRAWLRKLAPRLPTTITDIRTHPDGGLAGIVQAAPWNAPTVDYLTGGVFIPADRLVMFVSDREGADWSGVSILRTAYKHWLIRDQLIRVGAQAVERTGMGVPVVTYDPAVAGAREDALAIARAVRVGAEGGAALPQGMTLSLLGVQGQTVDALPQIEHHDRAIAASMLAMFIELGHTGGIGQGTVADRFHDTFLTAVRAVIRNVEATVTEHVIRPLVEANYGPDAPCPTLVADPVDVETATAATLKDLTDAGLVTTDVTLEAEVRRRYGLPAKPEPEGGAAAKVDAASASPFATVGLPALVSAGILGVEEGRRMMGLPPGAPTPPAPQPATAGPAVAALSAPEHDPDLVDRLAALTARVEALHTRRGHP